MFKKKAKDKILDFILWRADRQFYEKELAQNTGVSKSMVNLIMVELVKKDWVKMEEKGRLNLFQANLKSIKVRNYKKDLVIEKLEPLVKYLKGKADKLILFGSAAKSEDLSESDLDLAIVTKQQLETKKLLKFIPKDRKIQLIIKTPDGFRELRDKNKVLYRAILQGERLI